MMKTLVYIEKTDDTTYTSMTSMVNVFLTSLKRNVNQRDTLESEQFVETEHAYA